MRKNNYFNKKCTRWIGLTFFKILLFYRTVNSNVNGVRMQKFHSSLIFILCIFFCKFRWQYGKRGRNLYSSLPFLSTHKHSDIYFVVLHLRWLPPIINNRALSCQVLGKWDLLTSKNWQFQFTCWYYVRPYHTYFPQTSGEIGLGSYKYIQNGYPSKFTKFVSKNQSKPW